MNSYWQRTGVLMLLVLVAVLGLQFYFVARVVVMAYVAPASTAFQRSEAWRLLAGKGLSMQWRQQWLPYDKISDQLKRAVIASEDGDFLKHSGVEWDSIEKAWKRNAKAQEKAQEKTQDKSAKAPKIVGGSTITQQLAKNLLLSGERTMVRKGQEFLLTAALEGCLDKRQILELYLNHVEWGEGVFGAEAAAQYYYRKSAKSLNASESARLAVMLPRPRYYEKTFNSAYLASRTLTIVVRMPSAALP